MDAKEYFIAYVAWNPVIVERQSGEIGRIMERSAQQVGSAESVQALVGVCLIHTGLIRGEDLSTQCQILILEDEAESEPGK